MVSEHSSASLEELTTEPAASPAHPVVTNTFTYSGTGRHLKRAFDIVAVVIALPIIAIVFIVVMLGVAISSPGNPLFRQVRVGLGGRPFKCIKFRTMYRDAEARLHADPELYERYRLNDYKLPIADDPRESSRSDASCAPRRSTSFRSFQRPHGQDEPGRAAAGRHPRNSRSTGHGSRPTWLPCPASRVHGR